MVQLKCCLNEYITARETETMELQAIEKNYHTNADRSNVTCLCVTSHCAVSTEKTQDDVCFTVGAIAIDRRPKFTWSIAGYAGGMKLKIKINDEVVQVCIVEIWNLDISALAILRSLLTSSASLSL